MWRCKAQSAWSCPCLLDGCRRRSQLHHPNIIPLKRYTNAAFPDWRATVARSQSHWDPSRTLFFHQYDDHTSAGRGPGTAIGGCLGRSKTADGDDAPLSRNTGEAHGCAQVQVGLVPDPVSGMRQWRLTVIQALPWCPNCERATWGLNSTTSYTCPSSMRYDTFLYISATRTRTITSPTCTNWFNMLETSFPDFIS